MERRWKRSLASKRVAEATSATVEYVEVGGLVSYGVTSRFPPMLLALADEVIE
jgi:hypothetical protein